MNEALERLFADLLAAGVTPRDARDVQRSYALALRRQITTEWVNFYHDVYEALRRAEDAGTFSTFAMQQSARTTLLLLMEDDLGSTLFSQSDLARLRHPRVVLSVAHEVSAVDGERRAARA
jgi:hypothetical protein